MNIQAPPNLQARAAGRADRGRHQRLGRRLAGHARPRQSRSAVAAARRAGAPRPPRAGKVLTERLAIYPRLRRATRTLARSGAARRACCAPSSAASGLRRDDDWTPGLHGDAPAADMSRRCAAPSVAARARASRQSSTRAARGDDLGEGDIVALFEARGDDFAAVCAAADALRKQVVGDTVTYVVNRNINYTNICYYRCRFCAFSKGKLGDNLRGPPYDLDREEIARARPRGVGARRHRSLHAGRHPSALHRRDLSRRLPRGQARRCRGMHVHAFSPLEVLARRDQRSACTLARLPRPRCATPGSAACPAPPPKSSTTRCAQCSAPTRSRPRSGSQIMRGGARASACARRRPSCSAMSTGRSIGRAICCASATCRSDTGGFTEFVPLPFVPHGGADLRSRAAARMGPTFREAVLMHAVGAAGAAPAHPEHPDLVGEARRRRRRGLPAAPAPTISAAR